jgi:hypothetical protein
MQVWHTRLLSNLGDNADQPAPPGEQTVVMLTTNVGVADPHADCPGKVTKNLYRPIFIVTGDLSGPDSRVGAGTAFVLNTHRPVIYKGKTLLIGTEDIFENFPNAGMKGGVCSFKFVGHQK